MTQSDLGSLIDDFNCHLQESASEVEVFGRFKGESCDSNQIRELIRGRLFGSASTKPYRSDLVLDSKSPAFSPRTVLTVGINYGQVAGRTSGGHIDDTGMRPGLGALNAVFPGDPEPLIPEDYHLVAWNIFPYLTVCPWADLKLNGLEEALVIRLFGYSDWSKLTLKVASLIRPSVVVFHGVDNAVPYYGMPVAGAIRPQSLPAFPRVVFCGNLATVQSVSSAKTCIEIQAPMAQPFTNVVADY